MEAFRTHFGTLRFSNILVPCWNFWNHCGTPRFSNFLEPCGNPAIFRDFGTIFGTFGTILEPCDFQKIIPGADRHPTFPRPLLPLSSRMQNLAKRCKTWGKPNTSVTRIKKHHILKRISSLLIDFPPKLELTGRRFSATLGEGFLETAFSYRFSPGIAVNSVFV